LTRIPLACLSNPAHAERTGGFGTRMTRMTRTGGFGLMPLIVLSAFPLRLM